LRIAAQSGGTRERLVWIAVAAAAVFAGRLAVGGSSAGVAFLFLVPVGMATWWFGRRAGFGAAAACLGLYLVAAAIDPEDALIVAVPLRAAVLLATVFLVDVLRDRSERLEQDHRELAALREALTPAAMPKLPGLDVAVEFMPAEHGVSGDFYLLTNGPSGTNIAIVGDVCGHGPAAAQRATFARATLASVAASSDDPEEILSLVNRTLLERWTPANFLTATCIVHDPGRGTVAWATAGHPSPIRLSNLTELEVIRAAPLGVDPDTRFPTQVGALDPPDGLLVYTDGLLDARGPSDRFGEERLCATLAEHARGTATEVVDALTLAVGKFAGRRFGDDVCIIVLRAT
jgi:sigma-B regulation protein RsbU (phosphoserine phosphatase)